jgi:hypothetical protein
MNIVTSFVTRQPVAIFGSLTLLLTFVTYFLPLPREVLPFLIVLLPTLLAMGHWRRNDR